MLLTTHLCVLFCSIEDLFCSLTMSKKLNSPQYDPYSTTELEETKGGYKRQRMLYVNLRVRRLRTDGRRKTDKLLIEEAIKAFDWEYGDGDSRRVPKARREALSA